MVSMNPFKSPHKGSKPAGKSAKPAEKPAKPAEKPADPPAKPPAKPAAAPAPAPAPAPKGPESPMPPKPHDAKHSAPKFQVKIGDQFRDFDDKANWIAVKAFLTGQSSATYKVGSAEYTCDFKAMTQQAVSGGATHPIRPPYRWTPGETIMPEGVVMVIKLREGQADSIISVRDPNNKDRELSICVPSDGKCGMKMAFPVPASGESVEDVQKRQAALSTGAHVMALPNSNAVAAPILAGAMLPEGRLQEGDVDKMIFT